MDKIFKSEVSRAMGKFIRTNSGWKFKSVGGAIRARNTKASIKDIAVWENKEELPWGSHSLPLLSLN